MAHLPIPVLNTANVAQLTNGEWTAYLADVTAFEGAEEACLLAANPQGVFPAQPAALTANPSTPTTRLHAAMLVTAWLTQGRAMAVTAKTAVATAAAAAAAAAQAQAAAVQAAQGQQVVLGMNQLIQALQAIVPNLPAAAQPAAGPARIKMALPKEYTGNPREAKRFLHNCKNYFTLNAMNAQQRVLFTLQLIEGNAAHWKNTALNELDQNPPPLWHNDWELFKGEFHSHFADPGKREKALEKLIHGKVTQVVSVKRFLDEVVQTCQEAGWTTEAQWKDVARMGLKKEVTTMIARAYPATWIDFRNRLIEVDEEIQRLKGWSDRTPPKKTATSSSSNSNVKKEVRPDNSKFKLSDEEKKEHAKQNLCFKCHKKGHSSKDCKGERTVYSEFKKKKAQVSIVTVHDNPKGKGKEIAKIEEDELYKDEEDFPEGD
jgi:hypothetical protein